MQQIAAELHVDYLLFLFLLFCCLLFMGQSRRKKKEEFGMEEWKKCTQFYQVEIESEMSRRDEMR